MAVVTPPLFQTIDSVYQGSDLGLPYRDILSEGVVTAGDLLVSQRGLGANLSVDVAAGVVWVRGDDSQIQPTYRCYNNGTVNLAIDPPHASLGRIDRVVAEVRDAAFSGVSTDWRIRVITGTASGSPAAPAEPSDAHTLALVTVGASVGSILNANISDARKLAVVGLGPPAAKVYRNASLTHTSTGSYQSISWDVEVFDYFNMFSTGAADRIVCTQPGLYLITGRVVFTGNATGVRALEAVLNASTVLDHDTEPGPTVTDGGSLQVSVMHHLSAGDYVRLMGFQSSGGNLNYASGLPYMHMEVQWLRP